MNTAKKDFKRFCVLVCALFCASCLCAVAETQPVANDFTKTETQNSAIYFSQEDFKTNVTSDSGEVTTIKLISLPDRGSLTFQSSPATADAGNPH